MVSTAARGHEINFASYSFTRSLHVSREIFGFDFAKRNYFTFGSASRQELFQLLTNRL